MSLEEAIGYVGSDELIEVRTQEAQVEAVEADREGGALLLWGR